MVQLKVKGVALIENEEVIFQPEQDLEIQLGDAEVRSLVIYK